MTHCRTRFPSLAGSAAALALLALLVPGCVPYTSAYKPDPTARRTFLKVDPSAQAESSVVVSIEGLTPPTGAGPAAFEAKAVRKVTGAAIEVTRNTEQRYKNYWAPGLIPIGLLGVAEIPIIAILSPIIDHGKTDNQFRTFGGLNAKGCEANGFVLGAAYMAVGHLPTCEPVGEPRVTEDSKPAGKTVTEETPLADLPLRVRLLAEGAPLPGGKGIRRSATGKDGRVSVPLSPLVAELPDTVLAAEVEVAAEGEGAASASARAPIPAATLEALLGSVREERRGDAASASGAGLLALDHYSRAYAAARDEAARGVLFGKLAASYRSLPVKPIVPEEVRRLLVQAEALAKENDTARAKARLDEVVGKAPWLPVARYNRAFLLAMEKDYRGAIDSMEAYLRLAPDAPDARKAKDQVYQWETLAPPVREEAVPQAGVGITLQENEGRVVVYSVVPGGPAGRGGIRAGDVIEKVDGRSVTGMPTSGVASLCRGEAGSVVSIEVARPPAGERLAIRVTREPFAPSERPAPPGGGSSPAGDRIERMRGGRR